MPDFLDVPPQRRGVTWDVFYSDARVEVQRNDDAQHPVFVDDNQAAAYVFSIANVGAKHVSNPEHRQECRDAVREVVPSWTT